MFYHRNVTLMMLDIYFLSSVLRLFELLTRKAPRAMLLIAE